MEFLQKRKINMNYEQLNFQGISADSSWDTSVAFPALMRKVYVWMTLALVITGITAYGVANSPGILQAIYGNRIVFWGLMIAELALVIGVSGAINRLSLSVATLMFVLYSVINGATMSVIFLAYTMSSIATVFFITAGTFAAMAVVGYTTKRDLSAVGRFMFMGLIGIIIATVVNIFLKSDGLTMILSYAGVVVFVGLTAWDSQKIKQMLMQAEDVNEGTQKIALLGALSLYLDFINMFLYLLQIFGKKR